MCVQIDEEEQELTTKPRHNKTSKLRVSFAQNKKKNIVEWSGRARILPNPASHSQAAARGAKVCVYIYNIYIYIYRRLGGEYQNREI